MSSMNELLLVKTIIVYIYPVLSLIGLTTNTLSFIIFSRKRFKNTIFATYFRFLIIFDIFSLTFLPINRLFELNFNIFLKDLNNEFCKIRYYAFYVLYPISGWILTVVSLDRCLKVTFISNKFLTQISKSSFQIVMCLVVLTFNIVYYVPNLFFYIKIQNSTIGLSINQTNILTKKCTNPGIPAMWLDVANYFFTPFLLMVLFNSLTIISLIKSRYRLNDKSISKKDLRFVITTIFLNLFFLVENFPNCLYSIMNYYNQEFMNNKNLNIFVMSICYVIFYSHSASVFFVQITFNSMFKDEFKILFKIRS
jgi:hypothetical protein